MQAMSRVRWMLARHPWLYWVAVGLLAAIAGVAVVDAVGAVDEARRDWGDERTVLVARRDASPGEPFADVAVPRRLPAPMVPEAALTEAAANATLRQHVVEGEILTARDVAAGTPPRALIPAGHHAVAVAESVPSGANVGDAVAVASGGIVLSADALVVGAKGDAVIVAVPSGEAAAVAAASGDVALLLQP